MLLLYLFYIVIVFHPRHIILFALYFFQLCYFKELVCQILPHKDSLANFSYLRLYLRLSYCAYVRSMIIKTEMCSFVHFHGIGHRRRRRRRSKSSRSPSRTGRTCTCCTRRAWPASRARCPRRGSCARPAPAWAPPVTRTRATKRTTSTTRPARTSGARPS